MIYLDYSATTPVDDRVLETFTKVTKYKSRIKRNY